MKRSFIILLSLLATLTLGAQENVTYSPDSSYCAYTKDGNLYIGNGADVYAVTSDGSDLILNGYASWVYYEEIFRPPIALQGLLVESGFQKTGLLSLRQ